MSNEKDMQQPADGGQSPAPADPTPESPAKRPKGVLMFHPGYFGDTLKLSMDCLGGAEVHWKVPTESEDREIWEQAGIEREAMTLPDAKARQLYFERYVLGWTGFKASDGSDVPFNETNRARIADRAEAWLLMMLEMREKLFEIREDAEKN